MSVDNSPTPCQIATDSVEYTTLTTAYPDSGTTHWQVRRQDGQPINATYTNISIGSEEDVSAIHDIRLISASRLVIRLEPNTKYKYRVSNFPANGSHWSSWTAWTNFKTRDKRFHTPGAIRHDNVVQNTPITAKGNVTLTVEDNAKSNEAPKEYGSVVVVFGHPIADVAGNTNETQAKNNSVTSKRNAIITTRCPAPQRTGSSGRASNYYSKT